MGSPTRRGVGITEVRASNKERGNRLADGESSRSEDVMKRVPAFILLVVLGLVCSMPARAQIFTGPDSARLAQKAAKKQRKAWNKAAKKRQKAMRKYEKAQRKAAKRANHRA